MGNPALAEDLAGIDELYELNASETEPEPEDEDDEDEEFEPDDIPHG